MIQGGRGNEKTLMLLSQLRRFGKIAIISVYDSGVWFSVYLDGVVIDKDTIQGYYNDKTRVIKRSLKIIAQRIYEAYCDHRYFDFVEILSDYGMIFYIENGDVEVLK